MCLFEAEEAWRGRWLTLEDPFAIKSASRPAHSSFNHCEGAYSAVAQWQSIRLLTEGL